MKLLGSTKQVMNEDKNSGNVPKLESVEVVLEHYNVVNNNYQQASKVLFTFVSNKQFGQIINISPHSLKILNTKNTEFSSIEVWFTDQNRKQLKLKTLFIWFNNRVGFIKMRYSIELKYRKYVEGMAFSQLLQNLEINMVKK